jgi:hypothetical protein
MEFWMGSGWSPFALKLEMDGMLLIMGVEV